MSALRLRFGCGEYDRTRPLTDGTVTAEGIEMDWERVDVPHELFVRVLDGEFDLAEFSLSGLTAAAARGDDRLIGIPVFTSRLFRHSFIFVNQDGPVTTPQDLIGKRVGIPDYTVTAAVWIRGMLQHDYGVAPNQIEWCLGGLDRPVPVRPLGYRLPSDVRIGPVPEGKALGQMLEDRELDAVISPGMPGVFKRRSPKVRRLFPDYRAVEEDYYRRTGIVPIMHTLAVRRSVYEENRWIARRLFDAFCAAKQHAMAELGETGAPKVTMTWLQDAIERERAVFGDDPWPYGLAANRKTIEAFTAYSYEQGLCENHVPGESLYAEELRDL
jgi:4,5-dihydroxyphthalate decarboxylase